MNEILIYAKYDENNSIIDIRSNIFLEDTSDYVQIDKWTDGQDRYMFAHADNGEYVELKHGKPLYDENGRPNYHDDFELWTDEEKEKLYPAPEPQPSEIELLREENQLLKEQNELIKQQNSELMNFMNSITAQLNNK